MVIPAVRAFEVLSALGWLSTLPKDSRDGLLAVAELRHVPAGTRLYGQDDPPGGIFGIAEGFVDVLAAPGPFQMRLVHVAGAGWWAGEAALVARDGRRVEITARTRVTAVYIAPRSVERVAERSPAVWRDIATLTVRNLDLTMLYAAGFASPDLRLRVLVALLRIIGPLLEHGGAVSLPIGQAELAELSGLSRNTVSRLLARLAAEGCVERHYGALTVDTVRLRSLLRGALPATA